MRARAAARFFTCDFNPVILNVGPFPICWYGALISLGFLITLWLSGRRAHLHADFCSRERMRMVLLYCFIGGLIGGRMGHKLLYELPVSPDGIRCLFKFWSGGMSFHGGLVGIGLTINRQSRCRNDLLLLADFISPMAPILLGLGRLGNFLNGELWGRVAIDLPWAVLFPKSLGADVRFLLDCPQYRPICRLYGVLPRHPSQIYEMLLEGWLLFFLMKLCDSRDRPAGTTSGFFLLFYGILRLLVEFFRQPDGGIDLFGGLLSLGQILSLPLILIGSNLLLSRREIQVLRGEQNCLSSEKFVPTRRSEPVFRSSSRMEDLPDKTEDLG